jgi:hypothetical protein
MTAIAALARVVMSCGGGSGGFTGSPCQMLCEKRNSCVAATGGSTVPCDSICVYGGNYYPGLAPSPVCPNLAAQMTCVEAAVAMSCNDYDNGLVGCPACPPLDGSPCASDEDCAKYAPNYKCDLSRPGGYCTAPCQTSDDCSISGPETCSLGKAPSFDPNAPASQAWCLLSCTSDAGCRISDGYSCTNYSASEGFGICDVGAGGGDAGAQDGGGGNDGSVGPTPPSTYWAQVTCSVQRTECSGFVEDDSTGLDGLDVNCPASNLVSNGPFDATICYQTGADSTLETQESEAQNACDRYCADGWLGLYPLGAVANMGGMVTCSAQAQNQTITGVVAGQCSTTTGASTGATTFALCTLYGRQCNAQQAAEDGTQYCTSMPPLIAGQSTSACFDSTMTTAEAVCQNGFRFPMLPPRAANQSDQFPYWVIDQVVLEDNEADCQIQANNVGFAAEGIARGPIGVVHH